MKKRILSALLVLVMLISILPVSALAADYGPTNPLPAGGSYVVGDTIRVERAGDLPTAPNDTKWEFQNLEQVRTCTTTEHTHSHDICCSRNDWHIHSYVLGQCNAEKCNLEAHTHIWDECYELYSVYKLVATSSQPGGGSGDNNTEAGEDYRSWWPVVWSFETSYGHESQVKDSSVVTVKAGSVNVAYASGTLDAKAALKLATASAGDAIAYNIQMTAKPGYYITGYRLVCGNGTGCAVTTASDIVYVNQSGNYTVTIEYYDTNHGDKSTGKITGNDTFDHNYTLSSTYPSTKPDPDDRNLHEKYGSNTIYPFYLLISVAKDDASYSATYNWGTLKSTLSESVPAEHTQLQHNSTFKAQAPSADAIQAAQNAGFEFDGWIVTGKGYSSAKVNAGDDVTIRGGDLTLTAQWREIVTYPVTYTYVSGTTDKVLPSAISTTSEPYAVSDSNKYAVGATVTRKNPSSTTYDEYKSGVKTGTWTLTSWNKDNDTMTTGGVTFTGTWTFEAAPTYSYTLNYDANGGSGAPSVQTESDTTAASHAFSVSSTVPIREGYSFLGWADSASATSAAYGGSTGNTTVTVNKPASGTTAEKTIYAVWQANGNTAYKVEHYQQNPNGAGYTLEETENLTGTTGTTVYATPKTYEGFTYDGSVTSTKTSGNVAADGSLVLKLYYTRNSYKVTYKYENSAPEGATPALPSEATVKYGNEVTVATAPTATGWTFSGWSTTDATIGSGKFTMPANNVTLSGSWSQNYTVVYTWTGNEYLSVTPPTDTKSYATAAAAKAAVEKTYISTSTADGSDGYKYTFSGWGEGVVTGTVVTFKGNWSTAKATNNSNVSVEKTVTQVGNTSVTDQNNIPVAEVDDTIAWNVKVVNGGSVPVEIKLMDVLTGNRRGVTVTPPAGVSKTNDNKYTIPENITYDFTVTYQVVNTDKGETLTNAVTVVNSRDDTLDQDSATGVPVESDPTTYNIIYVLHDDTTNSATNSATNPTTYTVGVGVESFAPATRPGYEFAGWYWEEDYTYEATSIGADQTGDKYLHAKWTEKQPGTINLNELVTKTLNVADGATIPENGLTFKATVTQSSTDAIEILSTPIEGTVTITTGNTEDQSFSFGQNNILSFSRAGTYTFTIEEVNDSQENVTYDTAKYTLTVTVDVNKNVTETLKKGETTVNGASFTNTLSKPKECTVKVYAVYTDDSSKQEELYSGTAAKGTNVLSYLEGLNLSLDKDGYTHDEWYNDSKAYKFDTDTVVKGWTNVYVKYTPIDYTVVAKLYINGQPTYYSASNFYTFSDSGKYGESIDYDTIKDSAVAKAKEIHKASASYTAEVTEDWAGNALCTTFGEHQPTQKTHYVKVNVKTTEHVEVFASYDGELNETPIFKGTAPFGSNILEYLDTNVKNLDVSGYTHTEWYKDGYASGEKWKHLETDTVDGWTKVYVEYTSNPTITEVTKTVVTKEPNTNDWKNATTDNVPIDYPVDGKIIVPAGQTSVNVLYKITITGEKGATAKVVDDGATLIGHTLGSIADVDLRSKIELTFKESGTIDLYVYKHFTRNNDGTWPSTRNTVTVGDKNDTTDNPPTIVDENANISVTKTVATINDMQVTQASSYTVKVGDTITWQIVVENTGNVAQTLKLTDVIQNASGYASITPSVTDRFTLEAGNTKTFTASYTVPTADSGKTLTNRVTVAGNNGSGTGTSEPTTVTPALSVDKAITELNGKRVGSGSIRSVEVGDVLTYTVTVTNTSSVDQKNITVYDTLLEKWFTIGSLKAGKSETFSYTYTVQLADAGTTLVNTAVAYIGNQQINSDGTATKVDSYYPVRPVTPTEKPELNTDDHYAYVIGYEDGTVQPEANITRAEAATIFFRLLTDESRDRYWSERNSYSDVASNAWYNNAVSTLSKAGIISGYPDGTFRPDQNITRAEMSKIIANFAKLSNSGKTFSDINGHWAEGYIRLASGNGWIEGYPNGTFRPDQYITRAETMTMINRVLERVPSDESHLLPYRAMVTFPDCQPGEWYYIAVQEATNSHSYERVNSGSTSDEVWLALRENRDWTQLER